MDPLTITTSVGSLLATSGKLVKLIYDLRTTLKDAPTLLTAIIAECATVRTSLSVLQNIQQRWLNRPDLQSRDVIETFDTAVTSCALILFVLEEDMQACLKAGKAPTDEGAVKRAKVLLEKDHLQELVMQLRGQQQALGLLISSLQSQTIEQIRDNLDDSRDVLYGIARKAKKLGEESDHLSYTTRSDLQRSSSLMSSAATSTRFGFEAELLDSPAYQRALAYLQKLQGRQLELNHNADLIDVVSTSHESDQQSDVTSLMSGLTVETTSGQSSQTTPTQLSPIFNPQPDAEQCMDMFQGFHAPPMFSSLEGHGTVFMSSHAENVGSLDSSPRVGSIQRKPVLQRSRSVDSLRTFTEIDGSEESHIHTDADIVKSSETLTVPIPSGQHTLNGTNYLFRRFREGFGLINEQTIYKIYDDQVKKHGFVHKDVVFVSGGAAGATAAIIRATKNQFYDPYVPTIFETYLCSVELGSLTFELQLVDTAGQEDYDRFRPLSYAVGSSGTSDLVVIGIDISEPELLDNVNVKWFPEVHHFLPDTPIVLVGYKSDLRDSHRTIERLAKSSFKPVSQAQGIQLAKEIGATVYVECSSWTSEGIEDVFEAITKCLILQDLKKSGRRRSFGTWRDGLTLKRRFSNMPFKIQGYDPTSTASYTGRVLDRSQPWGE